MVWKLWWYPWEKKKKHLNYWRRKNCEHASILFPPQSPSGTRSPESSDKRNVRQLSGSLSLESLAKRVVQRYVIKCLICCNNNKEQLWDQYLRSWLKFLNNRASLCILFKDELNWSSFDPWKQWIYSLFIFTTHIFETNWKQSKTVFDLRFQSYKRYYWFWVKITNQFTEMAYLSHDLIYFMLHFTTSY